MRKAWLALLVAVLTVNGLAPCLFAAGCGRVDRRHECCAAVVSVQTNCCQRAHDSGAAVPVVGAKVVAGLGSAGGIGVLSFVQRQRSVATLVEQPVNAHRAPPPVLRT